jgi:hypothetical protein
VLLRLLPASLTTHYCVQDDGLVYLSKRDYGRVPSYLLARKAELAQAAVAADKAKEAALIPAGEARAV